MNIKTNKLKNSIYLWCCDYSSNSGEGILANKFISDLKNYNKNYKFKIIKPEIKIFKYFRIFFGKNVDRILIPLSGVFCLWFIYLTKKNKKISYVNYLPLWNFIIFFLLPPNTILGPITGGSKYLKKPYINFLIREYIFKFFNKISIFLISFRHKKILLATNLLQKEKFKVNKLYFNYVFKDLRFKKNKNKKIYDLIFYLRNHSNKNKSYQIFLANNLAKKFKIITIGDRINNKLIKNFGRISRKKVHTILRKTKFAYASDENLYSFFALDCFTNGTYLLHQHTDKQKIFLGNNFYIKNYQSIKKIISTFRPPKNFKINKINNFKNYFVI